MKDKDYINDDEIEGLDEDMDDLDDDLDDDLEIEFEDEDSEDSEDGDFEFKMLNQNKHRMEGKHSLQRDILFQGKLEEKVEDPEMQDAMVNYNQEVNIETGSNFEYESKHHEDYMNDIQLEEDIYDLLTENTDLDFSQNRRKPKREDFNLYYELLLENLKHKYTKCEIFVALSYYFTDNIFNMYKLLDKKHATTIIVELKNKGFLDNLGKINFV